MSMVDFCQVAPGKKMKLDLPVHQPYNHHAKQEVIHSSNCYVNIILIKLIVVNICERFSRQ